MFIFTYGHKIFNNLSFSVDYVSKLGILSYQNFTRKIDIEFSKYQMQNAITFPF